MQAIGRDITERKRLEQELEGREREFSTLVENSPDIISRLDRNLRYLYVSPIVERVWVCRLDNSLARPLEKLERPLMTGRPLRLAAARLWRREKL